MTARRIASTLGALIGAVVLAYFARELRLSAFSAANASKRYEDIYYLPPARFMPAMSLGFEAAVADILWCKSLVYFGDGVVHQGALEHVFEYTDAMLALDPSFRAAYRWVATAATYKLDEEHAAGALRAATYLERAVERWPTDGELRWDLGSLLRFDIAPVTSDHTEKDALLARAAPHLAAAARLGAGPSWLVLNNATLMERLGRTEQAIKHLEEAYSTIGDDDLRQEILLRLARLRSEAFAEAQRSTEARLDAARAAQFPYLSPDAFVFLEAPEAVSYEDAVLSHFLPAAEYVAEGAHADEPAESAGGGADEHAGGHAGDGAADRAGGHAGDGAADRAGGHAGDGAADRAGEHAGDGAADRAGGHATDGAP